MTEDRQGIPLDYERVKDLPWGDGRTRSQRLFFGFIPILRRLIFAAGMGLLAFGIGFIFHGESEGSGSMGWGAFLIGLTIPIFRREGQ
jgi:hypothetical protein